MPTSKLLYITSDASCPQYPNNTDSNFSFHLQQEIHLIGDQKVLSVAFKGLYLPGKIINDEPDYIQVCLNLLEHQASDGEFNQVLTRLPYQKEAGYIEIRHSKSLAVRTNVIRDIKVQLTDERGRILSIQNDLGVPTILKLEFSTMDSVHPSFTVACSSDYNDPTFLTRLPTTFDTKGQAYRVGLTTAILSPNIYNGASASTIELRAAYSGRPGYLEEMSIYVNLDRIQSITELLVGLNHLFIHQQIGLLLSMEPESTRVSFNALALRLAKKQMKESNMNDEWKDMFSVRRTTSFREEYADVPTPEVKEELIEVQLKYSWMEVTISDSFMNILNGNMEPYKFKIDFFNNRTHSLPQHEKANFERARPAALAVHTNIVSETYFGGKQDHLLQIIPSNRRRDNSSFMVYHPEEITYHDLKNLTLREIPMKITNLKGEPVRCYGNFLIVLHFKPAFL